MIERLSCVTPGLSLNAFRYVVGKEIAEDLWAAGNWRPHSPNWYERCPPCRRHVIQFCEQSLVHDVTFAHPVAGCKAEFRTQSGLLNLFGAHDPMRVSLATRAAPAEQE
jgi:hypothetical protein